MDKVADDDEIFNQVKNLGDLLLNQDAEKQINFKNLNKIQHLIQDELYLSDYQYFYKFVDIIYI